MAFTDKFIKEFKEKQNNTFEDNINKSQEQQNDKLIKLENQIFNLLKTMIDNRPIKEVEEIKFRECSKKIIKFLTTNNRIKIS